MQSFVRIVFLGALLGVGCGPAAAAGDRGRLLYENHCQACHASTVHVREARKARTPAEVRAYIARWSAHLKLVWGEEEQAEVFHYLNNRYYKLPLEK